MRKTLSFEEPTAKPLKKCLKNDGNKHFVVTKCKEVYFDQTTV